VEEQPAQGNRWSLVHRRQRGGGHGPAFGGAQLSRVAGLRLFEGLQVCAHSLMLFVRWLGVGMKRVLIEHS